jgi:hypothetical protein
MRRLEGEFWVLNWKEISGIVWSGSRIYQDHDCIVHTERKARNK